MVFGDLEKTYCKLPRELEYCMKKSGAAEKYVVQESYEDSVTAVRCTAELNKDRL